MPGQARPGHARAGPRRIQRTTQAGALPKKQKEPQKTRPQRAVADVRPRDIPPRGDRSTGAPQAASQSNKATRQGLPTGQTIPKRVPYITVEPARRDRPANPLASLCRCVCGACCCCAGVLYQPPQAGRSPPSVRPIAPKSLTAEPARAPTWTAVGQAVEHSRRERHAFDRHAARTLENRRHVGPRAMDKRGCPEAIQHRTATSGATSVRVHDLCQDLLVVTADRR